MRTDIRKTAPRRPPPLVLLENVVGIMAKRSVNRKQCSLVLPNSMIRGPTDLVVAMSVPDGAPLRKHFGEMGEWTSPVIRPIPPTPEG